MLLWNVEKKEKTTLIPVRKHEGETHVNLTRHIISFEILNNKDIIPLLNIILHSVYLSPTSCSAFVGQSQRKEKCEKSLFSEFLKVRYQKLSFIVSP